MYSKISIVLCLIILTKLLNISHAIGHQRKDEPPRYEDYSKEHEYADYLDKLIKVYKDKVNTVKPNVKINYEKLPEQNKKQRNYQNELPVKRDFQNYPSQPKNYHDEASNLQSFSPKPKHPRRQFRGIPGQHTNQPINYGTYKLNLSQIKTTNNRKNIQRLNGPILYSTRIPHIQQYPSQRLYIQTDMGQQNSGQHSPMFHAYAGNIMQNKESNPQNEQQKNLFQNNAQSNLGVFNYNSYLGQNNKLKLGNELRSPSLNGQIPYIPSAQARQIVQANIGKQNPVLQGYGNEQNQKSYLHQSVTYHTVPIDYADIPGWYEAKFPRMRDWTSVATSSISFFTTKIANANGSLSTTAANANGSLSTTTANAKSSLMSMTENIKSSLTTTAANLKGSSTTTAANLKGSSTTTAANLKGSLTTTAANLKGSLTTKAAKSKNSLTTKDAHANGSLTVLTKNTNDSVKYLSMNMSSIENKTIVQDAEENMVRYDFGYFTGFLHEVMLIVVLKYDDNNMELFKAFQTAVNELINSGKLKSMGPQSIEALKRAVNIPVTWGSQRIKAQLPTGLLLLEEDLYSEDISSVASGIDGSFTEAEGKKLLGNLVDISKYPETIPAGFIAKNVVNDIFLPYWRLEKTAESKLMFKTINDLLVTKYGYNATNAHQQGLLKKQQLKKMNGSIKYRVFDNEGQGDSVNKHKEFDKKVPINHIFSYKKSNNGDEIKKGKSNRITQYRAKINKSDKSGISKATTDDHIHRNIMYSSNNADAKTQQDNADEGLQHFRHGHRYVKKQGNRMQHHRHHKKKKDHGLRIEMRTHKLRKKDKKYDRLKQNGYNYEKSLRHKVSHHKVTTQATKKFHKTAKNINKNPINQQKRFNIVNKIMEDENDEFENDIRNKTDMFTRNQKSTSKTNDYYPQYVYPIVQRRNYVEMLKNYTKDIKKTKIFEESSYSDEEKELKFILADAVRHSDFVIKNYRKFNAVVVKDKGKINELSSYSDEEGVFKNNIYKAFGYDPDLDVQK